MRDIHGSANILSVLLWVELELNRKKQTKRRVIEDRKSGRRKTDWKGGGREPYVLQRGKEVRYDVEMDQQTNHF